MAPVSLRFLGSGDAFGSGGRFHTCLELSGGGEPLLIDCGATAFVALKRAHIDSRSLRYVALSHLHGDHFAGLPFLILDGKFAERTAPLLIAGPAGTQERLDQALEALYPGSASGKRPFELRFLVLADREPCELGPATLTPFTVRHESGAQAYALRIEYGGKVTTYSGDTEWTDTLLEAADGADLFVCEVSFFEKEVPYHIDYGTLAAKRAELSCKRIVITHMSEEMLASLDKVEIEAATDGAVVTV